MYEIKKQIYLDFTKNQKSALFNFLRALVKKAPDKSVQEIFDNFIDDEKYYLEINSSRFEFLADVIDEDWFQKDTLRYLRECRKYYDYKKSQEPFIQAQKAYEKKKREFLREVKMKHEKPTKKQIYYYGKLCEKYHLEKENTDEMSKFDIKEKISKIIEEHDLRNSLQMPQEDNL